MKFNILTYLLIGICSILVAALFWTMASRIYYPFELEFCEGGILDMVVQVLDGKPIYSKPSLAYTAMNYTPLYIYVSAGVAKLTGPGFLPLRIVSMLSTCGCLALLYEIARRETGSPLSGVIAAGVYAASYGRSGFWYDLARLDSMFLLGLLGCVFTLRHVRGQAGLIAAGAIMTATVMTKQLALMPFALLIPWVVVFRKHGFITPLVFAGSFIVADLLLNWTSAGWFHFYAWKVPGGHGMLPYMISDFWLSDLGPYVFPLVAGVLWLIYKWADRPTALFYLATGAGFIGVSWIGRIHAGGAENVLMPAHAALALMAGMAVSLGGSDVQGRSAFILSRSQVVKIGSALQMVVLAYYEPVPVNPNKADLEENQELLQFIRTMPGDVAVISHGYLGIMAGKSGYAHPIALEDVLLVRDKAATSAIDAKSSAVFSGNHFTAVLLDNKEQVSRFLNLGWHMDRELAQPSKPLCPNSWDHKRPRYICVPGTLRSEQ